MAVLSLWHPLDFDIKSSQLRYHSYASENTTKVLLHVKTDLYVLTCTMKNLVYKKKFFACLLFFHGHCQCWRKKHSS